MKWAQIFPNALVLLQVKARLVGVKYKAPVANRLPRLFLLHWVKTAQNK
jgi:hypothetical protein